MKKAVKVDTTRMMKAEIGSVHVDGALSFSNPRLGRLAVSGTTVTLTADSIRLEDVRVGVQASIHVKAKAGPLQGKATIRIPPMLPGLSFPALPLPKLETSIGSISQSGSELELTLDPVGLAQIAGRILIERIRVSDVLLPPAGFAIDGLGIGGVSFTDIGLPELSLGEVNLGSMTTRDDIRIPTIHLKNLRIEQPAGNTLTTSSAGITASATIESDEYGGDAGPIHVSVRLAGSLSLTVGRVTLSNARLMFVVDAIDLEGLELGIRGTDLRVTPVRVEQVAVDRVGLADVPDARPAALEQRAQPGTPVSAPRRRPSQSPVASGRRSLRDC